MWSPTGIARRHAWRAAITRNRFMQAFTITPRKEVYYRLRQKRTKYNLEKTNLYNRLYPEAKTAFSLYVATKIKRSKLTTGKQSRNRSIGEATRFERFAFKRLSAAVRQHVSFGTFLSKEKFADGSQNR